MSYICALILTVLTVECFIFLPFRKCGKSLLGTAKKSARTVLSNRISDHWKEKILLHYAIALLKETLMLFLLFICMISLVFGITLLCDQYIISQPDTLKVLSTPSNWVWLTVAAMIYVYLRKLMTYNASRN